MTCATRFPEELNGVGCFEALALRALAGSGYKLTWAADGSTALVADMRPGGSARGAATLRGVPGNSFGAGVRGGQMEYADRCGCASQARAEKLSDMVSKINRYANLATLQDYVSCAWTALTVSTVVHVYH
jgi:hypothetical protein